MKKIMNWFKKPALSLVFYALALLALIYTAYMFYTTYVYVASLVDAGSISWLTNLADIINYFISSTVSYLFYGLSFIFFGYVICHLSLKTNVENNSVKN